jgi:hypothetical protein
MANLLLDKNGFTNIDFINLPQLVLGLNETMVLARSDGDKILGNTLIGEIDTNLGFTLNELAWRPIKEVKEVIPTFSSDSQKVILKLLSFPESSLQCRSLIDLGIEFENEHNGVLGITFVPSTNAEFEITDDKSWYNFHRYYFVTNIPPRHKFVASISRYFPNLHFSVPSVTSGLTNFRGTTYDQVMKTIVHHLSALNDDFYEIFNEYRNEGADSICTKLEERFAPHQVKIGASRDPNGIAELCFEFINENGDTKILDCNLHTKFEDYFEIGNPSHVQKSNRIYFHHPTDEFVVGKVLIGRIGCHRDTGFH